MSVLPLIDTALALAAVATVIILIKLSPRLCRPRRITRAGRPDRDRAGLS